MIKITHEALEAFYKKRFINLSKSKAKTAGIGLLPTPDRIEPDNDLLFISEVDGIEVPKGYDTQLMKSMYGVPAGLFYESKTGTSKNKKKPTRRKLKSDEEDDLLLDSNEKLLIKLRAALLFATVWFEKNFGSKVMIEQSERFLNFETLAGHQSVKDFLLQLSTLSEYPARIPTNKNLNTTRFEENWTWLGVYLVNNCFAPDTKMDNDHKNWFLELVSLSRKAPDAPEKFKHLEPFIRGYFTAIYAREKNNVEVSGLFEAARSFSRTTDEQYANTFLALLFNGFFDGQAHCYYLVAAGRAMMQFLERLSYSVAMNSPLNLQPLKQKAHFGLLHLEDSPKENCINYYKFKNRAIAEKAWFDYVGGTGHEYPDKVALVTPDQAPVFLDETQRFVNFAEIFNHKILVAGSHDAFKALSRAGLNATFEGNNQLFAFTNGIDPNFDPRTSFFSLYDDLMVPKMLAAGKTIKPKNIATCFPAKSKVWVLFTDGGWVQTWQALLLDTLFLREQPEVVLSINYDYNNATFADNKIFKEKFDGFVNVHELCYGTTIRDIRQISGGAIWETVALANGVLSPYDYNQMMVVDARREPNKQDVVQILFRSTRDVLFFDDNNKYITININRI